MKLRRVVRRRGGAKWGGPSPLTAVILGLGLIIWFAQFVPTTIYSDCEYADYWVSGWFAFSSLFQWTGVAITAAAALWLVSLLGRARRTALIEVLTQGAILFALTFWFVAIKSYLFPHAAPQLTQMTAVVNALFPLPVIFDQGWTTIPPPTMSDGVPAVEFTSDPMRDPAINKRLTEIFTNQYSPTGADFARLRACVFEQKRASAQWRKDRETLWAYERDLELLAKPSRPRDWREEVMEELEREGPITE